MLFIAGDTWRIDGVILTETDAGGTRFPYAIDPASTVLVAFCKASNGKMLVGPVEMVDTSGWSVGSLGEVVFPATATAVDVLGSIEIVLSVKIVNGSDVTTWHSSRDDEDNLFYVENACI